MGGALGGGEHTCGCGTGGRTPRSRRTRAEPSTSSRRSRSGWPSGRASPGPARTAWRRRRATSHGEGLGGRIDRVCGGRGVGFRHHPAESPGEIAGERALTPADIAAGGCRDRADRDSPADPARPKGDRNCDRCDLGARGLDRRVGLASGDGSAVGGRSRADGGGPPDDQPRRGHRVDPPRTRGTRPSHDPRRPFLRWDGHLRSCSRRPARGGTRVRLRLRPRPDRRCRGCGARCARRRL